MTVTSHLFEAHLKCSTKCFLRSLGEADTGNAYAKWVQTQNEFYRSEGLKLLMEGVPRDEYVISPPDTGHLKTAKWRLAVDLVARAQNLESSIHAVERVPSEGRGQSAQFIPIRFIFTNKLSRDDKLLLAFDALVLSEMLDRKVGMGKIIHGDDQATLKVKTSALAGEVRKLTGKIATLLSNPSPPDLVLNRHCAECDFQTRCRQKALEKDDLSLLSGMTEKERKRLNSKGRRLAEQEYRTDIALKCKARLEKNRDGLFTFLDFDGVPWNNNNAEHAIKAFALLRRDFSGVATEKGIRDYLILLSICETCKCKGVSFLDFLLSGEKDIDAFADSKSRRRRMAVPYSLREGQESVRVVDV